MVGDFDAIFDLMKELSSFSHVAKEPGRSAILTIYEHLTSSEDHFILVAAENDETVGFVSVSLRRSLAHAKPTATIDELVVARIARGKGLGVGLQESTLERARALGCCEVEVTTEKDNLLAQHFYQKRGFDKELVMIEKGLDQ